MCHRSFLAFDLSVFMSKQNAWQESVIIQWFYWLSFEDLHWFSKGSNTWYFMQSILPFSANTWKVYSTIYCLPDLKYTCQHVEVYWISWVIGAVSTTIDRIKTATVVIKIWNVFIFHRLAKKKNWIQSNRTWKRDSWDLLTIAFHIMATSGTMVHFLR